MMVSEVLRVVSILFLVFLGIDTLQISFCHGKSNSAICIESEKQALLMFKRDLEDPSNRLSSWSVEEDCCKWVGVVCDNVTGHVQELHLINPLYEEGVVASYEAFKRSQLGGKINPSLLHLKYLSYLNLSNNNFQGIQIPKFLGSMTNLRYLDLYNSKFVGMIPHELGNLSSLYFLRISGDYNEVTLYADDLQWLSGLSYLEHLGLYDVDLSKVPDWLNRINMLPSLSELHLYQCQLDRIPSLPDHHINFTSLTILDMSGNYFHTPLPKWIFNLGSLTYLDLSSNNFKGVIQSGLRNITSLTYLDLSSNNYYSPIPTWLFNFSHLEILGLGLNSIQGLIPSAIGNMTSLTRLDLSLNELEGPIPRSLGNLCNLWELDLGGNKLGGEVSQVLESLSGCVSHSLESLSLDRNNLSGELTDQLALFRELVDISFGSNSISGPIPDSLGSLSSLRSFDVSYNQLNGSLPHSLGHLSNLELLFLTYNLLEGVVSEAHFANLTNLKVLNANGNRLVLNVDPYWIPPFQLGSVCLRSWHLGPQFPKWLNSQKYIESLDLSCTGISDIIPTWFWNISSRISYLNLSHNQIAGEIPYIGASSRVFGMGVFFYLKSNKFSGPLPLLSSDVIELDLSNNSFSGNISHFLCNRMDEPNKLRALNVGGNLLSGEIPNCWMKWPLLEVLKVDNNNLIGNIPSSMGHLKGVQSLHLRNNSLSGNLPPSLMNCTMLVTLDLGGNEFVGSIPTWIGSTLSSLKILNLRLNKFNGEIPYELCRLSSLQILDLAYNNLSGTIPRCVSKLEAMVTKRNITYEFSHSQAGGEMIDNALAVAKGREIDYDNEKILSLVAILDLSSNYLSGEVPEELTLLLGLFALNLSNNYLTGRIPWKIGDMVSLESLDLSRNQLSGDIPPSMSSMTFLNYLNLSYNNLSGRIPSSTQLQSFNDSSFVGNHLCGPPLTVNCSVDGEVEAPPDGDNEEDKVEYWFYLSMVFGFVVGFWAVFGPILFKRSWRYAYFLFLDRMWYMLCDFSSKRR